MEPSRVCREVSERPRKPRAAEAAAYRSELAGMVGSMDTMASSAVSREMVVFLEDRLHQCPGARGDNCMGTGVGAAPRHGTAFVHTHRWPCVIPSALSVFKECEVGIGDSGDETEGCCGRPTASWSFQLLSEDLSSQTLLCGTPTPAPTGSSGAGGPKPKHNHPPLSFLQKQINS